MSIRITTPHAPRIFLLKKENKEKKKENASTPLEKMIYFSLKMACDKMGIKI